MQVVYAIHTLNPSYLLHFQLFAYNFFKWSALVLALLAIFRIIVRFRQRAPSTILLITNDENDYDFSDTDDDNENRSTSSSEFEDDEEDDTAEDDRRTGKYFKPGGETGVGSFLRCRSIGDIFSLSEIANIRLGLGLGFGFDSEEESVVSLYKTATTTSATSAVVVTSAENAFGMRIWDTRLRRRMPAVIAEWGPTVGETVGVEYGGDHKVYLRDDGRNSLTVGDVRNVRSPLENVTEYCVDPWWPNSLMLKLQRR
ncbi:hypothetical protein Lal_00000200 [Lupinus albus]|uniref:Uncharacterized protein n=1 Tax=Lupinus albus TaxID=3870 RepID=A0A6A4NBS4_LUPAL|nr:hypothetical protein Lalb_Chr21g0308861 [Lupinus albus]KAF1860787.1 hypothetical protein Lal_00000200 [Lupinus albus]